MTTETMILNDTETLAHRMNAGRLPVLEALRYAIQLADSLRLLHEAGRVHGAIMPSNLALVEGRLELLPAVESWSKIVTPYTAPEVAQGQAADARSDLFGYGAILFEMLTGRRPFDGENRAALAANLENAPTPMSGNRAVDRLVGPFLDKNPGARNSRLKKVLIELKMLAVAARHADANPGEMVQRDASSNSSTARAEMQQLESRVAARLRLHERTVAEMHRSASETVTSLKLQMVAMSGLLAANYQGAGNASTAGLDDASGGAILSRVDHGFDALNARIVQIERSMEEMHRRVTQFEHNIAADLVDIEDTMKAQGSAIESSRTAMSQTDDLVERVVEALESLQSAALEEDGGGSPSLTVN